MKKLAGSKRPLGSMAGGRIIAFALLLMLAGQPGCKKSEAQPQLTEYKAMLNLASPTSDGRPVDQLVLDSTHETLVPINKKEGWPQTQAGPTPVGVQFIDAGKSFTGMVNGQVCHFREVYVVSFRVL